MANPVQYHIHDDVVTRTTGKPDAHTHVVEDRALRGFAAQLVPRVPLDTGFMPPGVVMIRQAGAHQRIVMVTEPTVNTLIWGQYERDSNAKKYFVAQPYRVLIGDFHNAAFLGGRQFYSPLPVNDMNARLYHANVPNLNCKGYGGTAVGWTCLYHKVDTTKYTLAQKAAYLGFRMSGNEAYNDANMSGTDGPRFYHAAGKPAHTYNPTNWEKKSEKEGFGWTLDEGLWIPVLVAGVDSQLQHDPKGQQLTLGGAVDGIAPMYYHDNGVRLFNNKAPQDNVVIDEIFGQAYGKTRLINAAREEQVNTILSVVKDDPQDNVNDKWAKAGVGSTFRQSSKSA